jgi:hypothetical protein
MYALRAAAVVTSLLLLMTGCGTDEPEAGNTGSDGAPSATAPLRCAEGAGGDETVLEPESGVRLPAAVYGGEEAEGGTVMVLLHQTNGDGRCGWDAFAQAAVEHGVASIAFDMCGWAKAECPEEWSARSSDQAAYAADYARDELGADRVVLVGASMGGARTVFAMADGVEVDDWVALSPAPAWDGREIAVEAGSVGQPGLVMHDPDDGDAEFTAARDAAERAGAEFVEGRGGHGYDMVTRIEGGLTPLGELVVERAVSGPAAG